MTSAALDDWNRVAIQKLTSVLGEAEATATHASGLSELQLDKLDSAADLHRFGQWLVKKGGFKGAVGALLSLHAAIHGNRE